MSGSVGGGVPWASSPRRRRTAVSALCSVGLTGTGTGDVVRVGGVEKVGVHRHRRLR